MQSLVASIKVKQSSAKQTHSSIEDDMQNRRPSITSFVKGEHQESNQNLFKVEEDQGDEARPLISLPVMRSPCLKNPLHFVDLPRWSLQSLNPLSSSRRSP